MTGKRFSWLLAAVVALAACGGDDDDSAATTTQPPAVTTTASSATTSVPVEQVDVRVYLTDANALLATGTRAVTGANVPRAAVEALLAGPEGFETELGWGSAIPADTELLGLAIEGGIATIDLSGAFEAGGGSASMLGRVAQIVYTLTQFPEITTVEFAIDGEPVDTIGGEGVAVDGVGRDDFTAVLPPIFVESPTPGQEVTSPVTASGLSNTFEATIQYEVADGEGLIVAEGFHTGGGTLGDWQPFDFTVEFEPERSGVGALILFEISAEDGSRVNLVEIPVQV